MQKFTAPIPLSLYVHIPWCVRKCPYCDFNSHEAKLAIPENLYVETLLQDLNQSLILIKEKRSLTSIFFGGGTPSLFSPKAIETILMGIQKHFAIDNIEITLEANPGTIDESRFIGFRKAGINRLSIGIQSLQDDKLKALGRIHNRDYALRAIETAHLAGFTNFNVDLMHGLPNQSIEDALGDLQDALHWQPNHLSWYQLTIEPNTFFHHSPPKLPQEEILWDIQDQGKTYLAQKDMKQYEVSAYCKPGYLCKHNQNYWEFGDYIGIGAGAHSKLTDRDQQIITRHWHVKNPTDYLDPKKNFMASQKTITPEDTIFEFMLNALRLTDGVPMTLFTERTGLSSDRLEPILTQAKQKKLLVDDNFILKPTEFGQRFLNDLISLFMINF